MLVTKPYIQYKEMNRIHGQGYVGLDGADVPRHSTDSVLQGEEEGNGRAIAEAMEDEHVSWDSGTLSIIVSLTY